MNIGAPLHPGHWSYDSSTSEWKGPDPYFFNAGGPFGSFQAELHWTLDIYIQLHRHAHASFRQHNQKIDELAAQLKAEPPITATEFEEREMLMIARSRRMDYIYAADVDLSRSSQAINRMYVVALWAFAEQYLGKIFQRLRGLRTGVPEESIPAPYRWDTLGPAYSSESIELKNLHDYAVANECRVLNNHIKHAPYISDKLAAFASFHDHLGKTLDSVVIDPQRYLNGVSNFIGSLIEHSNRLHGHYE
jgi:hypothetical protein